ncbi:hypothetical protein [Exiguobacterium mexicanum]|uniref:hypothetical protein n=1 Tax=Exiguobacterium mexicanum TaxID=340146 RepID=UPI0037C0C7A3
MSHPAVLETERYVTKLHAGDHTGHDMAHLDRVRRLAMHLAEGEAVDGLALTLAALLHDVEDEKLGRDKGLVARHLDTLALNPKQRTHILTMIEETSFSKGRSPLSRESAMLQDADRLDAIGRSASPERSNSPVHVAIACTARMIRRARSLTSRRSCSGSPIRCIRIGRDESPGNAMRSCSLFWIGSKRNGRD